VFKAAGILGLGCCGVLAVGCGGGLPDAQAEILSNLASAGFRADDVQVVGDAVYVGRDAHVTLEASREMLQTGEGGPEQYRTTNLVDTGAVHRICLSPTATFTSYSRLSQGLDLALQNYNQLGLCFTMVRGTASGCDAVITVATTTGAGANSGFPSGGRPYRNINVGTGLNTSSVDVVEHVLTHELGHTLGLRHSDYYYQAVSCNGSTTNEGTAGVGAILIPGTPSTASPNGSIMNTCFPANATGEFTSTDIVALRALYQQC
jgi:hypothetical protein